MNEAKLDKGKLRLSLVPTQIIKDVATIREYGVQKYHDPDNWKKVEVQRYIDAFYRHWVEFINDNNAIDDESGLPHYKHCACNMAFICELLEDENTTQADIYGAIHIPISTTKRETSMLNRFKLWLTPNKKCRHCCLWCEHFEECKESFK